SSGTVMREHLLFSPCGPVSLGPESLEIFRKPSITREPSMITPQQSNKSSSTRVSPDTCAVCGGPASGHNYEAVSCTGCKSFFRRAVLGKRKMSCREGGNCGMNSVSKALFKCRACRFARCLAVGMNPLAITGESKGSNESSLTNAGVKKLRHTVRDPSDLPSTSNFPPQLSGALVPVECSMDRLIDELVHLEVAHDRIRRSNYRPLNGISIDECIRGHSKLGADYGFAPPREKPHDIPRWKFIPMKVRIRDRIPVSVPPLLCEMEKCNHPLPMMWPHLDLVHTIEYVKTYDFFHNLTEAEKYSLVKHVVAIVSFLTNSFHSLDMNSDVTMYPDGAIPHSGQILQWSESDARHDREVHYETIERMRRMRMDRREYALIKALITCDPAIADLSSSSRNLLQQQRERYAKALMSYVLSRRGTSEGPSAYASILAHVDWLTRLVKRNKDLHTLICALGLSYSRMSTIVNQVYGA
ncbi:hypothetical protein PRIPAC_73600, partial [Pristionchus pacificus]